MMGNKTMRTNNTGSIPLCEKLDTKRRNVKEAHTQREQGGQADHIKHVPGNGKGAHEVKMASERTWAEPCSHAVTCLQEQDLPHREVYKCNTGRNDHGLGKDNWSVVAMAMAARIHS